MFFISHYLFSSLDIDECELGTHECDENALCENIFGNCTCQCNSGKVVIIIIIIIMHCIILLLCFTGDFTGIQVTLETVSTTRTLTNMKTELTTVTHTLIVRILLDPLIVHATLVGREMVSDVQVNKLQTH